MKHVQNKLSAATVVGLLAATLTALMSAGPAHAAAPKPTVAKPPAVNAASHLVRTDVPNTVMLHRGELPSWSTTPWTQNSDRTKARGRLIDPDSCDPTPTPQDGGGSTYPPNNDLVDLLTRTWILPTTYAMTTETIITYKSAAAAQADFNLHKSWLAGCAEHFSWTTRPHAQTVSPVDMPGMGNAYSYRAAMYAPGQLSSAAGTQGYVYTAVIQRGNALVIVVTTSDSGTVVASPKDPGDRWIKATSAHLADEMGTVYR